jgi:hypothetical protein
LGDRALLDRGPAPVATVVSSSAPPRPDAGAATQEEQSLAAIPASALPPAPPLTVAKPVKSGAETAPSARGLAAERALLDVARTALARGEAGEALEAADRHRREYPDGALLEEREAIAIKALVALGRRDEAAQRLAHLEHNYPNSLVLRAAKKAVWGSP